MRPIALILLISMANAACTSTRHGGVALERPKSASHTLERRLWLRQVTLADASPGSRRQAEISMTLNIQHFLVEGAYFRAVDLAPGAIAGDDLVAEVEIRKDVQSRFVNPAVVAAAFVTLSLYVWAAGPLYRDSHEVAARLAVSDASGRVLTVAEESLLEKDYVSFYSDEYIAWSGSQTRTAVIRQLFDSVVAQLNAF